MGKEDEGGGGGLGEGGWGWKKEVEGAVGMRIEEVGDVWVGEKEN